MPDDKQGQDNLQDDKNLPPTDSGDEGDDKKGDAGGKGEDKHHEPPEGSKRWNDIYYKAKEGERRVKELESVIEDLRRHNADLSEIAKTVVSNPTSPQGDPVADANESLRQLREERKQAAKDLDWDKVYDIEDKIEEVRNFIHESKNTPHTDVDKQIEEAASYAADKKVIEDFIVSTPWMSKSSDQYDEIMASAATALDNQLVKTWKGSVKERLIEVKNRVEKRFGIVDGGSGGKHLPPVQGAGKGAPPSDKSNVIELSDTERRVARNLFPEDANAEKRYFEQKQIIQKRRVAK